MMAVIPGESDAQIGAAAIRPEASREASPKSCSRPAAAVLG